MTKTNGSIDLRALPDIRVGDDVHATVERDAKGNPVLVLIAPLELDAGEQ